jgi:hypothetical protein
MSIANLKSAVVAAAKNKQVQTGLVIAATTVAVPAMAAAGDPPDVSAIVTYIGAAAITLALVANAKLLMELGVKAFAWIRRALGG